MSPISTRADAVRAAEALLGLGGRRLLGLAGPPGSGKSTLAALLRDALGAVAVVVPMDGFHLAQAELERLDRAGRKGAPDTFDAAGFVSLLQRLRAPVPGETVYAPAFRREIEEPVAGAIGVPAEVGLVIVEGNYLLLDGSWSPVRSLLDESWYVATDEVTRSRWLLGRHMQFGRTEADALAWIENTDGPNARLIQDHAGRASRLVSWSDNAVRPG